MSIIVGVGPYCDWYQAKSLFVQLGYQEGEAQRIGSGEETENGVAEFTQVLEVPQQLEVLERHLEAETQSRVVLLCSDLSFAVSSMLRGESGTFATALESWHASMQKLQKLCSTHRSQILLFELDAALKNPLGFLNTCRRSWNQNELETASYAVDVPEQDSLAVMIAQGLLAESIHLNRCNQMLKAMAQPLLDSAESSSSDGRFAALEQLHRERREVSILNGRLVEHAAMLDQLQQALIKVSANALESQKAAAITEKKLENALLELSSLHISGSNTREENELLLHQLHLVQEELESAKASQEATCSTTTKRLAEAESVLNCLRSAEIDICEEHGLLLKQLHLVQEELEKTTMSSIGRKEDDSIAVQRAKVADSEPERLGNLERDTREENELLLKQLHLVQEELEKSALDPVDRKADDCAIEQQVAVAESELEKLRALERDTREENELLISQLHQVQENFERLINERVSFDETKSLIESENQVVLADEAIREARPEESQITNGLARRWKATRQRKKERKALLRKAAIIEESHLFDQKWYLSRYPDVAVDESASANPALHYLKYGGFEGRNPGPHFDSLRYLEANPDVAASGMNPLLHYLKFGKNEGREAALD